jgi:hypothetical protein
MTDLFDPADQPATEPTEFVSGDLVQWRNADFPAYAGNGFDLIYYFRPAAGGSVVQVTCTVVGSEYRAAMIGTVTAAMAVGRWYWSAFLVRTSDDARIQVDDGETLVTANLVTDASDTRSHARKMLDAIEATMEGRATDTVQSYTIGGRQINKMSADEMIRWRKHYQNEVAEEQDAARLRNGLPKRNTITARFV